MNAKHRNGMNIVRFVGRHCGGRRIRQGAAVIRSAALVPLFAATTLDVRQAIHAVYYRNTALAPRITCFVDHIVQALSTRPFSP